MAQRTPRKSAREIEAREKVRARRASYWERERTLEDLATEYEVAADGIGDVTTETEAKIAAYSDRLRRDAEAAKQDLRAQQGESVGRMLELDGIRSVAERLGESVEVIRKLTSRPAGAATGSGSAAESGSSGTLDGQMTAERIPPEEAADGSAPVPPGPAGEGPATA